jgi:hypothetical protein
MDQPQPLRTGDRLEADPTLLHCVVEAHASCLSMVPNWIRPPLHSLAYHLLPVKDKKTAEPFSVEGLRKPEFVVLPHLGERKLAEIEPERCSLFRFDRRPRKFRSDKHSAEKTVAVQKFEVQFAPAFHVQRSDPEFLPGFADNTDLRRFSLFESAADPIDFSGAQTAFFPNHQHAAFLPDEAERGRLSRLPTGPIDSHDPLYPVVPVVVGTDGSLGEAAGRNAP